MIFILGIFVENYILAILLMGCIILISSDLKTIKTKKHKRVKELLFVIILLTISSAFRNYFDSLDYYNVGRTITYYLCYILRPPVIILFASILYPKKGIKCLSLLCLINTFIYTLGLFNVFTFSFTEANELIRGPFGYTSHILCLLYFLVILYIIIKQHNFQNKNKTVILLFFMLVCSFASYIDIVSDTYNLFDATILICGLEFYLFLYLQYNKTDILTKMFNRATFFSDIKRMDNKVTSVISIDMNNLKTINDTLGHDQGDKAIVTISNILLNVDSKHVRLYRVGGDEFVALCFYKDKEKVIDFINKAKIELAKTEYNCSFGYAYKDVDDVYEVYKKADQEMYNEKHVYHEKYGNSR